MRSRTNCTIGTGEVYSWAQEHLLQARLLKDHGWRCTASIVLGIVLRAAAQSISVSAACRDLSRAPSDHAVLTALDDGLPKTLPVLERRLNEALTGHMPRSIRRRGREVAIDWHLIPYYGEPYRSRNEICRSQPKQGTADFHAYATACIVEYGERYTLALTWVRRHESMVVVLRRLLAQIRAIGLKIKCLLLDRAFFNVAAMEFLQQEHLPFLMPVKFAGRPPKKGRKAIGLRALRQRSAGWYSHTMKKGKQEVTFSVCVGYRRYRDRRKNKHKRQKLLFAAWRVNGTPTGIRERYRKRFGIETSYRQRRQGRIYTCTRNPHVRLFFVAVSFILRNVWVWIHQTRLATGSGDTLTLHLELLRFKRMLDWIVRQVIALYHDGTTPCVIRPP
ncbi:MAG: transposase [Planctomycetia bacterium]|nr:transposase [Planctomycetia bacterium]